MKNGKYTKTEKYLLSKVVGEFCYRHACRSCPLRTDDGIRICHHSSWDERPDYVEKVVNVLREANYKIPKSLDSIKSISITEDELLNCFGGE